MIEARIPARPTGPGDPHTNTDQKVEYEVLHDAGGQRCGLVIRGEQAGHVVDTLCQREGLPFDPGEVRSGKVRWVPAREEQSVERWLLPVEDGADERGAFTATYIDIR